MSNIKNQIKKRIKSTLNKHKQDGIFYIALDYKDTIDNTIHISTYLIPQNILEKIFIKKDKMYYYIDEKENTIPIYLHVYDSKEAYDYNYFLFNYGILYDVIKDYAKYYGLVFNHTGLYYKKKVSSSYVTNLIKIMDNIEEIFKLFGFDMLDYTKYHYTKLEFMNKIVYNSYYHIDILDKNNTNLQYIDLIKYSNTLDNIPNNNKNYLYLNNKIDRLINPQSVIKRLIKQIPILYDEFYQILLKEYFILSTGSISLNNINSIYLRYVNKLLEVLNLTYKDKIILLYNNTYQCKININNILRLGNDRYIFTISSTDKQSKNTISFGFNPIISLDLTEFQIQTTISNTDDTNLYQAYEEMIDLLINEYKFKFFINLDPNDLIIKK